MPIYEYQCEACKKISSILILNAEEEKSARCAHCHGDRLVRVLSRFALHKTETQRMDEFDTRAPRDDTFYKDDRNIGLWAKKRARELGADSFRIDIGLILGYQQLGEMKKALEMAEEAKKKYPDNPIVNMLLMKISSQSPK